MYTNVEEIVDFNKLRNSNDLCKKWADIFDIKHTHFMSFIIDLNKNYKKYYDLLEAKHKKELRNDYKNMWYALEVEDGLVRQYKNCIFRFIKKFQISIQEQEELISIGMITIRNAVWKYRTHESEANFLTFIYTSLSLRLKGLRLNQLKRNKVKSYEDIDSVIQMDFHKNKLPNYEYSFEDEKQECEDLKENLIKGAVLSENERNLLIYYMNRKDQDWCKNYIKENPKPNGKFVSRQAVHQKLKTIQRKIWIVYMKIKKENFLTTRRFAI